MNKTAYKCTLLTDVIITKQGASDGIPGTLDFIPGNNFLGIAAAGYSSLPESMAADIFHNGKVRFGDGHLASGNVRTLMVPASMYHPKGDDSQYFISHKATTSFGEFQLKQCRSGFYNFSSDEAVKVTPDTTFAIKSARDKAKGRSKDGAMFGYESLCKGVSFIFEVEADNDNLATTVKDLLIGEKRLGRSKTAQYGLVKIDLCPEAVCDVRSESTDEFVTVYADGRLIFIDENGNTTFKPTASQLGLPEDAEIRWDLSQIRTFQYAPWNSHRKCADTDRCGLEKGSVIVAKMNGEHPQGAAYVGAYRNEGFGKVIFDPAFLAAGSEGKAIYNLRHEKNSGSQETVPEPATRLAAYLKKRAEEDVLTNKIYDTVNDWVNKNERMFSSAQFASQWGAIRSIAISAGLKDDLYSMVDDYLGHGVASPKWNGHKKEKLLAFIEEFSANEKVKPGVLRQALINLASEMGKKCKR